MKRVSELITTTTTQTFTLIAKPAITDEQLGALFEAGGDDMTVGTEGDTTVIEVDREAVEFVRALVAAIEQVESVGLEVERVEPDDYVYATEIAERMGRTRQSVDMLIRGERGSGDFPRPVSHAGERNPLWRWSEVAAWFADYEKRTIDDRWLIHLRSLAAVNGLLEFRRHARGLPGESLGDLFTIFRGVLDRGSAPSGRPKRRRR